MRYRSVPLTTTLRHYCRVNVAATLLCALAVQAYGDEPNRIYDGNCALCHQKTGRGLRGQFPRLAGRATEIAATAEGRRYLIEVVLFGMAGKVDVDGAPIVGVMPSFVALSDSDLASVLNYVTQLDGPATSDAKQAFITEADVQAIRLGQQLSAAQVRADRDSPALKRALAKRTK